MGPFKQHTPALVRNKTSMPRSLEMQGDANDGRTRNSEYFNGNALQNLHGTSTSGEAQIEADELHRHPRGKDPIPIDEEVLEARNSNVATRQGAYRDATARGRQTTCARKGATPQTSAVPHDFRSHRGYTLQRRKTKPRKKWDMHNLPALWTRAKRH